MLHPVIAALTKNRHFHMPDAHVMIHKAEHLMHSSYLTLVSIEAHGFYRYAAMGCVATIVLSLFTTVAATEE